ncbi:hypothetical protein AADZ91_14445 [Colwelliaceae bacterium 6441]
MGACWQFKRIKCAILFLLPFVTGFTAQAEGFSKQTKKTLIWLVEDKKENIDLLEKVSPNTSVASYIESRVIAKLTQYDIQVKRMSMKRIEKVLKTTDNACVANRAKLASRQKHSLFSSPQAFYLTHKLYRYDQKVSLDDHLLNEQGEVKAIHEVLSEKPNQIMGVAEGVSFGAFLDAEIKKIAKHNIYYRGGVNRVTALEGMLYAKRIDFLLALPIDIKPSAQQALKLEQYPISGAPPYLLAHFNCSKSAAGANVIKDINGILANMYQTEDYTLAHQKWFTEQDIVNLKRYLKQQFSGKSFLKN